MNDSHYFRALAVDATNLDYGIVETSIDYDTASGVRGAYPLPS
ncbi:MAG: hypothetical protein ACR2LN_02620 [Candidatus Levyibacteriota bacterium]